MRDLSFVIYESLKFHQNIFVVLLFDFPLVYNYGYPSPFWLKTPRARLLRQLEEMRFLVVLYLFLWYWRLHFGCQLIVKTSKQINMWSVLGSSWGAPGLFWYGLRALVACLNCPGVVLGSSWGPPGLLWGGLGALVACLRPSWRRQGPSWTCLLGCLETPRALFAA